MRGIVPLAMTAILLLVFAPVAVAANEPLLAPRADKPLPALSVRKALPPPHPETIRVFATMIAGRLVPGEFGIHLRMITKNSETPAASAAPTRKDVLKLPPPGPQRTPRRPMPPVVGTSVSLAEPATAIKVEAQSAASCTSAGCPPGGCSTRGSWRGIFRLRGG